MSFAAKSLTLTFAAVCAALAADPALARQNRGGRTSGRARAVLAADAATSLAGAKLKVELRGKSGGRAEFRMAMELAPAGLAPEAWIADASGALTLAGPLVADPVTPGEYRLRLRTKRGDALPAGAGTLADLAGRAFEVRDASQVLFDGTIPALGTRFRDLDADGADDRRGRGADDGAAADAGEDGPEDEAPHEEGPEDAGPDDAGPDDGGGRRGRG